MTLRVSNEVLLPVRYPAWYSGDARASVYRYFTTDLLTNTITAEIPFTGVSYERAIKSAGQFNGSIPVIPNTSHMNLYESTMPGKSGLYVTRDGVCVWGGIIWTRAYDLNSQSLKVTANEFTSYLHHRNIWKTFSNEIGATITKSGSTTTALLEYGAVQDFGVGSSVQLIFREVDQWQYNGYYTVTAYDGMDQITLDAPYLPVGTYPLTTIYIRTDTYDFIRSLIDATMVDFLGISFANDEIEPATGNDIRIIYYQATNDEVTVTTQQPHGAIAGQTVEIRNVEDDINGQFIIDYASDATHFTYTITGLGDILYTYSPVKSGDITSRVVYDYDAQFTTAAPHGLQVGDICAVSGVDDGTSTVQIYDGIYQVTTVPTPTSFTVTTSSVIDRPYQAATGTVVAPPYVTVGTYGSYPFNSDLWIEYSTASFSGNQQEPMLYRGFEVRSVGEELDVYTDQINAFEYRIDCVYDEAYALFRRIFYMIPIDFPNPPDPGQVSPPSRFGADELVFTYPGNIMDYKMDESSENAATRFFMVGNIPDLGADISQPYAVATATDLLQQGWPLLDATEATQDIEDEAELMKYAERYLAESRPPLGDFKIVVNGSMTPMVGGYRPGDWCSIIINDDFIQMRLASDLEPRDDVIVRKIDSYKVTVPDYPSFPEKVDLSLIAEWQVDNLGQ